MAETEVERLVPHCAGLFLDWFRERYERPFALTGESLAEGPEGAPPALVASDGRHRLALIVDRLYEADDPAWEARRRELEERLSSEVRDPYLLWVPPGGRLPTGEPWDSDFVLRFKVAASPLAAGGRAEVELPVKLGLTKRSDEGAHVAVVGPLSRHWATISKRVRGAYYMDATHLHRVTASEEKRQLLFDEVADLAGGLQVQMAVEFAGSEAWTVQRLRGGEGVALVAAQPASDPTDGVSVRRILRKRLRAANARFEGRPADLHALVLAGVYEYAGDEGASAALKGFDPSLYSNTDLVSIIADGEVRIALTPRVLPWGSRT
jgi:hypothetical protein